jgi:hypothetical protein
VPNALVSIYVPHILVKYIFFDALQQQFLFPCHGHVSTNHFPHQIGAQTLPVVWCNHKIHSFDKTQSRFVKGQADWQKFFEQVGASEIWRCWSLWPWRPKKANIH